MWGLMSSHVGLTYWGHIYSALSTSNVIEKWKKHQGALNVFALDILKDFLPCTDLCYSFPACCNQLGRWFIGSIAVVLCTRSSIGISSSCSVIYFCILKTFAFRLSVVRLPPPFTILAGFVHRGKLAEAQDGKLWHRYKMENFGTGTRWKTLAQAQDGR